MGVCLLVCEKYDASSRIITEQFRWDAFYFLMFYFSLAVIGWNMLWFLNQFSKLGSLHSNLNTATSLSLLSLSLSLSLHYWFVIVSIVAYHKYLIATSLRSLIFLHSTQLTHNVWALSGRIVDWECTENLDRHPKNSSSTIFRVSKWSAGSGAAVLWPHELRAAYYFSYLRKKKKLKDVWVGS